MPTLANMLKRAAYGLLQCSLSPVSRLAGSQFGSNRDVLPNNSIIRDAQASITAIERRVGLGTYASALRLDIGLLHLEIRLGAQPQLGRHLPTAQRATPRQACRRLCKPAAQIVLAIFPEARSYPPNGGGGRLRPDVSRVKRGIDKPRPVTEAPIEDFVPPETRPASDSSAPKILTPKPLAALRCRDAARVE
jgi:hypothetical protein